jgi:hypothetical protein
VGAVQLVVSLTIEFVTFFDRLTDMLNCFNDYLNPLAEYSKASNTSQLILRTLASVYGDLLEFCSAARRVFVDNSGARRRWISVRTFLRVQWEPFEGQFGEIQTRFRHHLNVLQHSAEAIQLNTILRLENKQSSFKPGLAPQSQTCYGVMENVSRNIKPCLVALLHLSSWCWQVCTHVSISRLILAL